MVSYIDKQLKIIEKIDNNILSEVQNYYYKYIYTTEQEFIQESLTKSKNKIEGNENTIMGLPVKQIKDYLGSYEWFRINYRDKNIRGKILNEKVYSYW